MLPVCLYLITEIAIVCRLNIWHLAAFGDFCEKKRRNARGFARAFLRSCKGYGPGWSVKRCRKSSSALEKNLFHKWRSFRSPWPTLPGPGHQPLDGNISLKFLLETRLQSKSSDTLDDLLGFRAEKVWSNAEVPKFFFLWPFFQYLSILRDPIQSIFLSIVCTT